MRSSGLCNKSGSSRTVRCDRANVSHSISFGKSAEAGGSGARGGTANYEEAEALNCPGDQFAIERLADENSDALAPKAMSASKQGAVPEDEDTRAGELISWDNTDIAHVFVPQSGTEEANEGGGDKWNEKKGESLNPSHSGRGRLHKGQFTLQVTPGMREASGAM